MGKTAKEMEMMYDKVMNPEKYRKKYGHLEKQKLLPPAYIQKKIRKGRNKDNEQIDFLPQPQAKMPPQPKAPVSYFDSLGKGKSLAQHEFSIKPSSAPPQPASQQPDVPAAGGSEQCAAELDTAAAGAGAVE